MQVVESHISLHSGLIVPVAAKASLHAFVKSTANAFDTGTFAQCSTQSVSYLFFLAVLQHSSSVVTLFKMMQQNQ